MKPCNLLTLSAVEILNLERDGHFVLDLNDPLVYNSVVASNEAFDECAMQFQILDEVNRDRTEEKKIRTIERLLVFLDFDRVSFGQAEEESPKVKNLFKDGMDILFEDETNPRHFLPFEKSASMARRSRISFLCDEWTGSGAADPQDGIRGLKARMDKRLGLEIEIKKTVLSKLAAYRGLYFTTSRRIESSFLELNEKSVIVVDDYLDSDRAFIKNHTVVTALNESGDGVNWEIQTKEKYIELTPFDGEGLIAPEWAKIINYRYNDGCLSRVYGETAELLLGIKELHIGKKVWTELLESAFREAAELPEAAFRDESELCKTICNCLIHSTANFLHRSAEEIETAFRKAGCSDAIREKTEKFLHRMSSFQVRMPFAKGVLHSVDFHSFIGEFLEPSEDGSEPMILDMFGRKRSLKEAKIIMTRSMFKCAGWLKDHCGNLKTSDGEPVDPMKYYFEKFHEYRHGLYVGNTDALLRNNGTVKINYQFLGTVNLDAAALQQLVDTHVEYADKLKNPKMSGSAAEEAMIAEHGNEAESGEEDSGTDSMTPDDDALTILQSPAPWCEVLRRDPRFVNDSMIRTKFRENREYLLRDLVYARLIMKGECRFLSCDLLSLLHYLMQLVNAAENKDAGNERISAQKLQKLSGQTLHNDRFYLPQAVPQMELNQETSYVFLRNPHLSRNEECVLKPYIPKPDSYYSRYMGHLKGVVMVGRLSLVPSALGGADHDGDLVKILNNSVLADAVEKSVGLYLPEEGTKDFARKIPEIMIPSPKADLKEVGDFDANFRMIRDTFSNKVGHISNLAIQWGRDEYFLKLPDTENKCAECAILTGLEIDACKNGCHPSLKSVERNDSGKDPYLKGVKYMRNVSTYSLTKAEEVRNGDEKKQLSLSFRTYGKKEQKVLFEVPTADKRPESSLDRLLRRYAEYEVEEKEQKKTGERVAPVPLFPCMCRASDPGTVDTRWRDSLDPGRLAVVRAMIRAYNKVMETCRIERNNEELRTKVKYRAFIWQILQYQSPDNTVDNRTLEQAREYIAGVLPDHKAVKGALERLSSERWMYTPAAKRTERLYRILHGSTAEIGEEILEANKAWVAMLSDFSCSGYNLLYYLLKDRLTYVAKTDCCDEDEWEEEVPGGTPAEESQENDSKLPEPQEYPEFFRTYIAIYRNARDRKIGRNVWEAELVGACRADLVKYFSNEAEKRTETEILAEAVPYAYAFRGTSAQWNFDRNGRFFWNVLTPDAILRAADLPDASRNSAAGGDSPEETGGKTDTAEMITDDNEGGTGDAE